MRKEEIKKIVRQYLFDVEGKVFDDEEILRWIEDAARSYSEDAECFAWHFEIRPDADGKYRYPDDYICYLTGWNADGLEIEPNGAEEIGKQKVNYRTAAGQPEWIFDGMSDPGKYEQTPNPCGLQGLERMEISGDYGTDPYGYGVVLPGGRYGTLLGGETFSDAGEIHYIRYGGAEEVKDHMALVYRALHLAYSADSDFADPAKAEAAQAAYRKRIGRMRHIAESVRGIRQGANYF